MEVEIDKMHATFDKFSKELNPDYELILEASVNHHGYLIQRFREESSNGNTSWLLKLNGRRNSMLHLEMVDGEIVWDNWYKFCIEELESGDSEPQKKGVMYICEEEEHDEI